MKLNAAWRLFMQAVVTVWLAPFILMVSITGNGYAQAPLHPQMLERALACSDLDAFMNTMGKLPNDLAAVAKVGLVRREQVTNVTDGKNDFLWEYRFLQSFPMFGMQPVGIGNSLGMLPALVVVFDEPLLTFRKRYERTGFKFECATPNELQGESCEGSLDIAKAPPGEPPLKFLVTITESPVLLKVGKTLVACTVIPREGNIFR